jgi:predicted RNA-binding Zn ribbon-like protein
MSAKDVSADGVPWAAALVRDFVNTLDVDEGTDELDSTEGLTEFLGRHGLLSEGATATERHRKQALRLRTGLHEALELNHSGEHGWLASLDEALSAIPVRLRWTGDGVVTAPVQDGVAGGLARVALAAHEARASELWWRLKICAFDECEWAYYDQSKNQSRNYCEYGCGNKQKTRAYRARLRAAGQAARSG